MKKFSVFILVMAVLMAGLLTACAGTASESKTTVETKAETNAETTEQADSEIPEDSILYFNNDEGSAKLIQYFADGNVPEEAYILYDQMGSNPEVTITDPEKIQELYRLLGMVTVVGETDETITDNYHYVKFKLADDSYVSYSFEGKKIWCYDKKNYSIENSDKLFDFMSELTDEYLKQES